MQTISPFLPMNNGKKIKIGNYFLGKTIGKGNSAVVKVAVHGLTKQLVAIKIFDKNALDVEKQVRLRREIDSMKRLKHPNIIRLYEIMETNKLICLVTEYASNGELYDYIIENKRLSERKAREIFRQILASLNHCHSCGIVHRDLKVENLLFDSTRRIKLADFGFSCTFKPGELLDVFCGSPPYCAPELYLAHLYDGPKVDIWSLGVVLYVLVCGYLPFDAQSFNILRSQVISGSYKIPFFLSEDCKNLIKGMLMIDPSKRFDINEILNHRWLKTVESDDTASENGFPIGETKNLKEFRNLISKIENISIEEFEPNQDVLNELLKYNLNLNEVIKSVKNNEFDSNAGIYYLTEAKLLSRVGGGGGGGSMGDQLSLKSPIKFSPLISVEATSNNSPQLSATLDHKYFTFGAEAGKSDESSPFYGYHKVNMIADDQESVRSGGSSSSTTATTSSTATTASEQHAMAVAAAAAAAAAASIFAAASTGASTETNSNCDEDEMPPIEELGRDYLSRYNSIRRHTIATNEDNEMLGQSNNIMKSTECLLNFGQGSGEPIIDTRKNSSEESTVQSCSSTSSGIAGGSNTNNTSGNSHLSNGFTADLVKCFNLSLNPNNSGSSSESRFESTSPTAMSSNPYTTVRKSSQNEIELNRQHQQLMSGGLGKTKTKSHVMHTHYCKSKSINSKCLNLQQQQQPQQPQLGVPPALLTSPSHLMQQQPQQQPYILPPKPYHQSYQVGPYLSPPILSGRRASDGGSNISLFNHIYSLKHSHKPSCNDSFTDNVQGGVGSELLSDMSGDLSSQLGGVENNLGSSSSALAAAVAAYNSCGGENQSNDNTSLDQDQALSPAAAAMTARMSKPRGSITSGMPISMLKSQLSGAGSGTNLKTNNAASSFQSASEDEDSNCCVLQPPLIFTPTNISAALLMQHRKSSGRQTSELAASFGGLDTGSGGASIVRGSSSTRQREQSFSGTNSSPMYFTINENLSDLNHRSSVPNQFDLIHANRLHLEKIYNQSIDNSKQQHIIAVAAAAAVSNKEVPPRLYDNQASERGDEIKVNGDEQMDDSICAPNANFMVNFCPQIVENQLQNEKLLPSINQQQQSVVSPQVTPSSSNSSSSNGETSANNSTMDPSPSSHLQMIQEEQQNEIAAMMSSESSSLCSSVSTTPRMSRTSFGAPPSSQHHRAAANSETGLPPPPLIITPNEVYSYQPPHHYNRQPAPQIDDELMAFESDDRRPKKSKNCTIDT